MRGDDCQHAERSRPPGGARGSLRRLTLLLLRVLRARADEWSALWRAEVHRILALTALTMATLFFVLGCASFAALGVVFWLWDMNRGLAFGVAAGLFGVLAIVSAALLRHR